AAAPHAAPSLPGKAQAFVGYRALIPDVAGQGRSHQGAILINVAEQALGALHDFEYDVQDFAVHFVIGHGEADVGDTVLEREALLRVAQSLLNAPALGDVNKGTFEH